MENLFQLFYKSSGVTTDTRKVLFDKLYIGLKGANFDGNEYAQKAIESGAKYAVVDNEKMADGKNIFYVKDSLLFLQQLAKYHRNKFQIPVIGITGTNGKTTTKELTAAVLSKKYNVLFTQGNLNNHIGVPLTLLELKKENEIALIEMGASKLGDIEELCAIANPTHGIITNIGTAHIAGFGSVENVLETKTELYRFIENVNGHLFFNHEDFLLKNRIPEKCTVSSYGFSSSSEVWGELIALKPEVNFKWHRKDYSSPVIETKIIGSYNLLNFIAATSIGAYFSVDFDAINHAIYSYKPNNNRSQLEKTENNRLLMDAYNANPSSMKLALKNFSQIEEENKLFILGDMLELGEKSKEYHQEIIHQVEKFGLHGIFVGDIFVSLLENNDIVAFPTVEEATSYLQSLLPKDNLILLKGSRGIQLEKLVKIL